MIVGGSLGLGLWYREQLYGRLRILRELMEILEMFAGEIGYGKATLPECCGLLASRVGEPYRGCLQNIYIQMQENTGMGFGRVYHDNMQQCMAQMPLTKGDKEFVLTLFADADFADGQMQIQAIRKRCDMLEHTVEELSLETKEKSRMAVGLGVMGGFLLLILLL